MSALTATFVVVGGGIAGVTCAESLAAFQPNQSIILICASHIIKTTKNLVAITRTVVNFDVENIAVKDLTEKFDNITVIQDTVVELDGVECCLTTKKATVIHYQMLCLCLGATANLLPSVDAEASQRILGIRDTDSVMKFQQKLTKCRKIAIVGNGGIASELVYKVDKCDIDWVIKTGHISSTFVDPGASEFFLNTTKNSHETVMKRWNFTESEDSTGTSTNSGEGAALGPDWCKNLSIFGGGDNNKTSLKVHYNCQVLSIESNMTGGPFALKVRLDDNSTIDCDLVVSAIGVEPNNNIVLKTVTSGYTLKTDEFGAIEVDESMRTSLKNVFAAGDCCAAKWPLAQHWFQMRLWSQARQMGEFAAKAMSATLNGDDGILQDFCFELFTHCTKLFGYKVILLGLFNGQKLDGNYEIILRTTPNKEYIKLILQEGRLQGAILIGDTDLEEMCENLILNQLDLSPFGTDILNPDIDIEDYFD